MSSHLLRSTLQTLRAAPARAGLRRAGQQWLRGEAVRPFASSRAAAASAAVVEAQEASSSSQAPQQQEGPAFRAFIDFK